MATKNNLDVGGEAPVHKDLSNRYRIEGNVYDLGQIVAAVKGEQSNDDWNKRTLTDRLDAVKTYLKDMNAEKVDDAENTAGDGETVKDGTGKVIGGEGDVDYEAEADELRQQNERLTDVVNTARGELDLPAMEGDVDPSLVEGIQSLKQQIKDVRDRLKLTDTGDILAAVDELFTKATEAEQRATVAEQDASKLRTQLKTAQERATRGPALHGHVDDLKAPY